MNRLFEFVFIILSPKDNNLLVAISATLAFVRIMVNFNKLDINHLLSVIITKRCEKSHEIHFFFICDKIWTYFGVKAVPINFDTD